MEVVTIKSWLLDHLLEQVTNLQTELEVILRELIPLKHEATLSQNILLPQRLLVASSCPNSAFPNLMVMFSIGDHFGISYRSQFITGIVRALFGLLGR